MSQYWEKVRWDENFSDEKQPYESGLLKLNCDKALHQLNWHASLSFQETVKMTAEWYCSYYENPSTIHDLTISHIQEYETKTRNIKNQ